MELILIRNIRNMMRIYCFGINLISVTVFIFARTVLDPFPSFCSTPLPTQTSLPNAGTGFPRGGMLFGRLVEQSWMAKVFQDESLKSHSVVTLLFLQRLHHALQCRGASIYMHQRFSIQSLSMRNGLCQMWKKAAGMRPVCKVGPKTCCEKCMT